MAVTLTSFKAAFPEFAKAGDTFISTQLALAELEVSDSFGVSRDLAVMLYLADSLATSPWGRTARLLAEGEKKTSGALTSTYGHRYLRMKNANAITATRMGSCPTSSYSSS